MKGQPPTGSRPEPAPGPLQNPRQERRQAHHQSRSWARAAQAMRCLPFRRSFYDLVATTPLSSGAFCRRADAQQHCSRRMGSQRVEDHWIWLIQVGVLRREVDGQGLTERVRLTPMGRELLEQWHGEIPQAPLLERVQHQLRRRRPRL